MSEEKKYWEARYASGGDSGKCSVGPLKAWRWKIVKKHVSIKGESVLDVGCGDLRFWEGINHEHYTGIDISSVIIAKNRKTRPKWCFICADAASDWLALEADVVFCFEMLFHIMTDESLIAILQNLNKWTRKTLFVSCWSKRPDPFVYPHYQRHNQLEDYLQYLPDLTLKKRYVTDIGLRALYVFERLEE